MGRGRGTGSPRDVLLGKSRFGDTVEREPEIDNLIDTMKRVDSTVRLWGSPRTIEYWDQARKSLKKATRYREVKDGAADILAMVMEEPSLFEEDDSASLQLGQALAPFAFPGQEFQRFEGRDSVGGEECEVVVINNKTYDYKRLEKVILDSLSDAISVQPKLYSVHISNYDIPEREYYKKMFESLAEFGAMKKNK